MTTETFSRCEDCTAPDRCGRMGKCLQLPPEMAATLDDIFGVHRPALSGALVGARTQGNDA